LVHLPNYPLDGGDAAMQLAVPIVAENRMVLSTPPKAKAWTFLKRSEPPPETLSPTGPCMANQEGETAMLRQQLLEAHGRAGMFSGYVVQAMGILQEREAWWRRAAAASINERAIVLREAQPQGNNSLGATEPDGSSIAALAHRRNLE
jgi:hypothetical protein